MSPGNLYRYFPSKEAIIAGIAERNRAEVGELRAGRPGARLLHRARGLARHHFARAADGGCAVRRDHGGEPPQPRDRPDFRHRADMKARLVACCACRRARRDSRATSISRARAVLMIDRRRHLVAPRGRSRLQARSRASALLDMIAMLRTRPRERGRNDKKESSDESEPHHRRRAGRRRRAWIASGYLLPHEHAESHAAIRSGEGAAQKLFRVAVSETELVPHSRKLVLSGRTEADAR